MSRRSTHVAAALLGGCGHRAGARPAVFAFGPGHEVVEHLGRRGRVLDRPAGEGRVHLGPPVDAVLERRLGDDALHGTSHVRGGHVHQVGAAPGGDDLLVEPRARRGRSSGTRGRWGSRTRRVAAQWNTTSMSPGMTRRAPRGCRPRSPRAARRSATSKAVDADRSRSRSGERVAAESLADPCVAEDAVPSPDEQHDLRPGKSDRSRSSRAMPRNPVAPVRRIRAAAQSLSDARPVLCHGRSPDGRHRAANPIRIGGWVPASQRADEAKTGRFRVEKARKTELPEPEDSSSSSGVCTSRPGPGSSSTEVLVTLSRGLVMRRSCGAVARPRYSRCGHGDAAQGGEQRPARG